MVTRLHEVITWQHCDCVTYTTNAFSANVEEHRERGGERVQPGRQDREEEGRARAKPEEATHTQKGDSIHTVFIRLVLYTQYGLEGTPLKFEIENLLTLNLQRCTDDI